MPDLLPNLSENTGVSWAEEVEAENQLPPRQEFYKDNIKTIIEYKKNDETGVKSKVTSVYRIETKKVSSAVAHRKKLKKFGQASGDPPGPNPSFTTIGEQIKIQFVRSRGGESILELAKPEDDTLAKLKQQGGAVLRCRYCKNPDHMTPHCPYKDMFEAQAAEEEAGAGGEAGDSSREKESEEKMKSGTYVPPSLRGGAVGAAARATVDLNRRDDFTVRVTNLSEETTDSDLKELFSGVGKVQRIFLAKDKATTRCKGFAFVTYNCKEDADKAIKTISGHRYDHLILKVEWAKPTT